MKSIILAAAAMLALATAPAMATAYTFQGDGTFSNCGNCSITGGGDGIAWGGSPSSTMNTGSAFNDFNQSMNGNTSAGQPDQIGEIDWKNSENNEASNPTTATFTLSVKFTSPPPGGIGNLALPISITNTANNAQVCFLFFCQNDGNVDDTTTIPDGGSFSADGFTLSNLSFSVSGGGSFNTTTNTWSNPEDNTSTLKIFATIAVSDPPPAVPEPASMAVLGVGLLGLGTIKLRRRRA